MMTQDQFEARLEGLISEYLEGLSWGRSKPAQQHYANLVTTLLAAAIDVAGASLGKPGELPINIQAMRRHLVQAVDKPGRGGGSAGAFFLTGLLDPAKGFMPDNSNGER